LGEKKGSRVIIIYSRDMKKNVYNKHGKEAVKKILKECATPGTIWSRHLQADDVIDIWRETNKGLITYSTEPTPFDTFYFALQQFKTDCPQDFEAAASAFILRMEMKSEGGPQEKGSLPRRRRVA
jgi:hypothetical protein